MPVLREETIMTEKRSSAQNAVERYLCSPGINFPRFIIFENRTGCYIDSARSIHERNEKIRALKRWNGFDIRWDFFRDIIRRANPTGTLFVRDVGYTSELTIKREIERMARWGEC